MDDRSSNLLEDADSFAADALVNAGARGELLFVINLCAANVPQSIDAHSVNSWGISGLERYKLYQVSRMEDGRRRYRVRLGFFKSEADAEAVLQTVRGRFATAFFSCLADEDLKHASGFLHKPLHEIQEIQDIQRTGRYRIPKIDPQDVAKAGALFAEEKAPAPRSASATHVDSHRTATTARVAKLPAAPAAISVAGKKSTQASDDREVEIEWNPPQKSAAPAKSPAKAAPTQKAKTNPTTRVTTIKPRTPPAAPAATSSSSVSASKPKAAGHYHVGAGRDIEDHGFSLSDDVHGVHAETPAISPKKAPAIAAPKPETQLPRPLVNAEALAKLRAAAQPRQQATVVPTLDSTQTIRTLTKKEKEDAQAPKWFVVQLAISEQPANLETMPRLDIFEAYRLYSVASMDGAVIRHALRLGFFSEQVSAEAVLGYLKTFFADPRIERVSDAEQKRFANGPKPKVAPHNELTNAHSETITLERPKFHAELDLPLLAPDPKPTGQAPRSASKSGAPAVKRGPQPTGMHKSAGTKNGNTGKYAHLSVDERVAIKEARSLGLSETAIRRVEHNPSLLSRLVDKLTK